MLQTKVYSNSILFFYLFLELGNLFICMDDEAYEVLSGRILRDGCCPDLPSLDSSGKHELDAVVSVFLRLDELRDLDFPCFEVYLHTAWTFKALVVVELRLELWKSTLMSEELLECFVKMRDCRCHALDIHFSHPRVVFLELVILIRNTYAHPSKMLLQCSILLDVKVESPVVDKTHSPKMLS